MLTTPEPTAKDAVAYHRELAAGWEQRYRKPAFKARLRAVEECLAGHDLHDQHWLDAGCGSGTLARYLLEAGANVLGVDAAEEMITLARKLASQGRFWDTMSRSTMNPNGSFASSTSRPSPICRSPSDRWTESFVRVFWSMFPTRGFVSQSLRACCAPGASWSSQ